jgi:hypothetical protein
MTMIAPRKRSTEWYRFGFIIIRDGFERGWPGYHGNYDYLKVYPILNYAKCVIHNRWPGNERTVYRNRTVIFDIYYTIV